MLVRHVMIEDVTSVGPDDTLSKAYELIQTKKYDCLPVTSDRKHIIGLVQLTDIYEAVMKDGRQAALQRPVRDVMVTNLVTIGPDDVLERAARMLFDKDIPLLPVVDDGEFLGIVNEADIFKAFSDMLGAGSDTLRLTLVVPDRKGALADIAHTIRNAGINITHVATFHSQVLDQYKVVVRVEAEASRPLVDLLEGHGYKVLNVDKD